MTKFLTRILYFSLILLIFLSPLLFFKIGGEEKIYIDNPVAAIIDKHKRIDSLDSPRLVIVGGSNAFYGINSQKLRDSLNLNVVNMGLFAGFGLDFMLNELEKNVKEGDHILFSIEYFLPITINPKAKEEILRYYPEAIEYFDEKLPIDKKIMNLIKVNVESIQNIILRPLKGKSTIYVQSRKINEYGDAIGYLSYGKQSHSDFRAKVKGGEWKGIELLNQFKEKLKSKHIRFYFVFPPSPKTKFDVNSTLLEKYESAIKKDLNMPVLGHPKDMIFNDDLFFDTEYHMNKQGRELRTNVLIKLLKPVFSDPIE